jgi:hypothetical protein
VPAFGQAFQLIATRTKLKKAQTITHLQPSLKRFPRLRVPAINTGQLLKSHWPTAQKLEQASVAGGDQINQLVKGLEQTAAGYKRGQLAVPPDLEKRLD